MSDAVRVRPTPASRIVGDESLRLDLDEARAGVTTIAAGRYAVGDPPDTLRAAAGAPRPDPSGFAVVEVVVDGWRFELEVEDDARATLRERATRDAAAATASGPLEIRAIIPGRIAAVRVNPDEAVTTGQTLLVVEAMKMQNELRAPRDGRVTRVAVGEGTTIELGDLLVVLE